MIARLARLIRSFTGASVAAASPIKAITGIVISLIIPYLMYAFLGGFGLALAFLGIGWVIWRLANKRK